MGFFAGSINVSYHRATICGALVTKAYLGRLQNILGPRLTLSLGTTGYSLYIGSLWAYQVHGTSWFLILAGALLGISMGFPPLDIVPRLIIRQSSRGSPLGGSRCHNDGVSPGEGQRPLLYCLLVHLSARYASRRCYCLGYRGALNTALGIDRSLCCLYGHYAHRHIYQLAALATS